MCEISANFKLCTCHGENEETFSNFWVLKRQTDDVCIVGQTILPADIDDEISKLNQAILHHALNERNCFDIAIEFQEQDILHLHFTYQPESPDITSYTSDFSVYAFRFMANSWVSAAYESSDALSDSIFEGEIRSSALKKNI